MASAVSQFLTTLPPERAAQLRRVRAAIRRAPKTTLTLHLMPVYFSPATLARLQDGFRAAGKRLDIGKACIHFKTADDLALDCIAEIVAAMPVEKWVVIAKSARQGPRSKA